MGDKIMSEERALNLLIANVYCTDIRLDCLDCPVYNGNKEEGCQELDDDKLLEAVRVLKK